MPIFVYNTLTGKKEKLIPQEDKKIKMYVCGITPYDACHLGHARCYVVFDIIRRYLEYRGYQVEYIQNFTDIDDKIIKRSKELGVKPEELAEKYINEFFFYSEKLNLKPAKVYPQVTQEISQIIKVIEGLIDKGYAYLVDGNVFFSVRKFPQYGKLSKRNLESMSEEFARIEIDERKKDPLDFALWKSVRPTAVGGEPYWDSPWGKGRPGWHIECSTMSMEYLGETLDIHGGGQDLIFPHHENEIAQSEAYTGKQFVHYWLHNGFVTINKEKMSKSLGNFFTLEEIFQSRNFRDDPMVVRYYLISQHYRSPLDFSDSQLLQAKSAWESLVDTYDFVYFIFSKLGLKPIYREKISKEIEGINEKFQKVMDDDFNTAEGIAEIFSLREKIIRLIMAQDIGSLAGLISLYRHLLEDVLGLKLPEPLEAKKLDKAILNLLDQRENARKNNNFSLADALRKEIENKSYLIEDTVFGPRLKQKQ